MKYWIFTGSDAVGPYSEDELRRQPGFSLQTTVICPNGAMTADQWKPARDYIAEKSAPSPLPAPAAAPAPEARLGTGAEDAFEKLNRAKGQAPAQPAAEARLGTGAEDAFERLAKPAAGAAAPAAAVAAPAAAGDEDPIDRVFRERREAAVAARKAAEARSTRVRLASFTTVIGVILTFGILYLTKIYVTRKLASAPAITAKFRAHVDKFRSKKAASAGAAAAPAPAAAVPPTTPSAIHVPPAKPDATAAAALDFARSFPVQSRGRKKPAEAVDIFAPQKWTAPQTLGEFYDQAALEALARDTNAALERQGHSPADGDREIRRSAQLWKKHADAYLQKRQAVWSATPALEGLRVEVRLKYDAAEPIRRFEVDPAKKTLKPVGLSAWHDLDPKAAARWGSKYLRLSEEADDGVGGPQTPVYSQGGAAPRRAAKIAAASAPAAPPRTPRKARPAPRAAAKTAKAAPAPQDEEEYDDPTAPENAAKPAAAAKPTAQPAAPPAEPADQPSEATVFSDLKRAQPPAPAAAAPAPEPPAPAPRPGPAAGGGPPKKSVADMSVEELQRYLNRDKK